MNPLRSLALAAFLAVPGTAIAQEAQGYASAAATGDIVETATAAGSFTTLAKALQAAGLVETLKGKGPFTVFAPTDEAFAKLPEGALEDLLKPENKAKLQSVLTYHLVPGKVMSRDAVKLNSAKTAQGSSISIKAIENGV